tara:strand:+ start:1194 stop:1658 length:465 start_codon:yes stop_codon:yes gene_type:complete
MSEFLTTYKIPKDWVDYNNHLNMAYYVLIFDKAWEIILEKFQMGETSAKKTNKSTMVVETHTTYNNEVKENENVDIILTHFDHDKKRLHYKLEMIEKNSQKLSATIEMISLYVDLKERRVAEFEQDKLKLMDSFIVANKSKFKSDLKFSSKLKK